MSIKIVTYNILAQAYVKPSRYLHSKATELNSQNRRQLLLKTLTDLNADIYALQEVEPDVFHKIIEFLGADKFAGKLAMRNGKPDGSAIIYRSSKLRPTTSHEIHYQAHDKRDDQCALVMIFEDQQQLNTQRLAVASTHLRWQPDSKSRTEHIGRLQLIELLNASQDIDPDAAWVLTGDFNANSQSVVLQAALERGWSLSCRSQRPWDTTNINGRRRKIDYLLYQRGTLSAQPGLLPKLERHTAMPSEIHASDHLPVCVEFQFPAHS